MVPDPQPVVPSSIVYPADTASWIIIAWPSPRVWRSVIRNYIFRLAACLRLYNIQALVPVNLPVNMNSKFKLNFFFSVSAASWLYNFKVGCTGDLNKPVCLMPERYTHWSFLGIWIIYLDFLYLLYVKFFFPISIFVSQFVLLSLSDRAQMHIWHHDSWWAALQPLLCSVWTGL